MSYLNKQTEVAEDRREKSVREATRWTIRRLPMDDKIRGDIDGQHNYATRSPGQNLEGNIVDIINGKHTAAFRHGQL